MTPPKVTGTEREQDLVLTLPQMMRRWVDFQPAALLALPSHVAKPLHALHVPSSTAPELLAILALPPPPVSHVPHAQHARR